MWFCHALECNNVTLRNAIIKRMTTGTLSVDHVYLVMAYCSNIERTQTSEEEPTASLRRLATLQKRKLRAGATEEAKTVEKLRCREQKQRRDLDESEREARLMKSNIAYSLVGARQSCAYVFLVIHIHDTASVMEFTVLYLIMEFRCRYST